MLINLNSTKEFYQIIIGWVSIETAETLPALPLSLEGLAICSLVLCVQIQTQKVLILQLLGGHASRPL